MSENRQIKLDKKYTPLPALDSSLDFFKNIEEADVRFELP